MRRMVTLLLCLSWCLIFGRCSSDDGPAGDGKVLHDQAVLADGPAGADAAQACKDGEKRCNGMWMIQVCSKGAWQNSVSCEGKTYGSNLCSCSITMMYVCAYGTHVCP